MSFVRNLKTCCPLIVILLAQIDVSHAILIYYEGFNDDAAPGASAEWTLDSSSPPATTPYSIGPSAGNSGLEYTSTDGDSLLTTAGHLSFPGRPSGSPDFLYDASEPPDPVGLTDSGSEYFVSFLFQGTTSSGSQAFWSQNLAANVSIGVPFGGTSFGIQGPINTSTGVPAYNGQTHLLVGRFKRHDSATIGDSDQIDLWINPANFSNMGTPDASAIFNADSNVIPDLQFASGNFRNNSQPVASRSMDELRIGTTLEDVLPGSLAATLRLNVFTDTGEIRLVNETTTTYDLVAYQITSPEGTLNASGFLPLESQNREDFPSGSGVGDGWEVVGTPDADFLSEQLLTGSSMLLPDAAITLGSAYDTSLDKRDLQLNLLLEDGSLLPVTSISYAEASTEISGDYNRDGEVNLADYTVWRNSLGVRPAEAGDGADGNFSGTVDAADYALWKLHFGTAPPSSGTLQTVSAIPESSSMMLLTLPASLLVTLGRKSLLK